MEVPMVSERGTADAAALGVEPRAMAEVLGRSRLAAALVEQLQELVGGELDLLVTPFRGPVMGGDQPGAVQAPEVAVDEGVARLGLVGRAIGEPEVPGRVLVP